MDKWKEKRYIDLLNDINTPYSDIHRRTERFLPNKLYRYRSFGEHWMDEIFKGQVYMANANEFNDPFDSLFYIDLDLYVKRASQEKKNLFEYFGEKRLNEVFSTQMEQLKVQFQNYIRIGCFSEKDDSILMWSHYADNHKGFCIEYDVQKINEELVDNLLPVIYSKDRFEASMCLESHQYNIAYNPALYKALEWSYEQEWRLFSTVSQYNKGKGECAILDGSISAIYVGAKCEDKEKIYQIKNWTMKKGIPIYRMKMSSIHYKLDKDNM